MPPTQKIEPKEADFDPFVGGDGPDDEDLDSLDDGSKLLDELEQDDDGDDVEDGGEDTGGEDDAGKDDAGKDDAGEEEADAGDTSGDEAESDEEASDADGEGDLGPGEDQAEDDSVETGGEEGDDSESDSRNDVRIPKPRFDKVNERRKAAEARVKQLEREALARDKARETDAVEELDLEAAVEAALAKSQDGEAGEAAKELARVVKLAAKTAAAEGERLSQADLDAQVSAALEARDFNQARVSAERDFPFMRTDHKDFDPDLVADIVAMSQGFQGRGYTPADALNQAIEYVMPQQRPDAWNALYGEPADSDAPAPNPNRAKKVAQDRKRRAVKKNVEAKKRAPKEVESDARDEPLNIDTLTDDELDALPEATLARMRGDVL